MKGVLYLSTRGGFYVSAEVWSTDITYIRLQKGFIYLMAIIDWYSRDVLTWQISTILDNVFVERLWRSLKYGHPGAKFLD